MGGTCDRAALHALRSGPGSVPTADAQVARAIENDESSELSLALAPVGLQTALPVTRMCALTNRRARCRVNGKRPMRRRAPLGFRADGRQPGTSRHLVQLGAMNSVASTSTNSRLHSNLPKTQIDLTRSMGALPCTRQQKPGRRGTYRDLSASLSVR
jgi:hypothetical protein